MQELQTITPKEYLTRKGIEFRESGKELITHCVFNDCDSDSRGIEAHLYFDAETGQYECKKCGEEGNLVTLAKHFGDGIQEIALNPIRPVINPRKFTKFDTELVETCHQALPAHIRQYLNARGIIDAVIDAHKLGWGKFYGKWWITIPIPDIYGAFLFFKLRQDPNTGDNKITYPKGVEAQIYGWETLQSETKIVLACEGELDRLALLSKGIPAFTSTHGAMTFKSEWCEKIGKGRKIYICYDNDEAGRKGTERTAKLLENTGNELFIVSLPPEVGDGGDITDYLIKLNGNPDDLFGKYAKEYPEKIDTSQFKPLSDEELTTILGKTIKKDITNKLITFYGQLSAYTENSQYNIGNHAPSSTGKSYIAIEISYLFPKEDVIKISYASPTAFYHKGIWNNEFKRLELNLSRKIIIFIDLPHTQLLQRLRPLLSHDEKEIRLEITDKTEKYGIRTKEVVIKGYPSVFFCTAGLKVDEQEATRMFLLSPETTQEKIREGVREKIRKDSNIEAYYARLASSPERTQLKQRILAIKKENINDILIHDPLKIEKQFFQRAPKLKPRHQRDVGRIICLIKMHALLNLWFRKRVGDNIETNDEDIIAGFKLWDEISESQELGLPPYLLKFYHEIILTAWDKQKETEVPVDKYSTKMVKLGLSRKTIIKEHWEVYGRPLPEWQLRQDVLPPLEAAGLIYHEPSPLDKREILVYPTTQLTISQDQNNSEPYGGVKSNLPEKSSPIQRKPCFVCSGTNFWQRSDGVWICSNCHPPTL